MLGLLLNDNSGVDAAPFKKTLNQFNQLIISLRKKTAKINAKNYQVYSKVLVIDKSYGNKTANIFLVT